MIPAVAKRGTSFKGAGQYYLHDKKLKGEKERTTSERVAWTETRNLMTDKPEMALKIMAYTAMDKDRLKQQAGIKNTGQKSKGDVYAYSIAWHPDETGKFDKVQMLEAVDQSLKAIGAQDHQAVIVAHRDEPQPHAHIILNLVSPENGLQPNISNDYKKLEKWAHEYRKARGEEQDYCPQRTKKMEAIEARKRGENVPFVRGGKNTPRSQFNDLATARTPANKNGIKVFQEEQRKKDQILIKDGALMNSRHSHEWDALKDNYKLKKDFISQQYKKEKEALKSEIYAQNKPVFSEVYRQQWKERKDFERREKRVIGKIENVIKAVKYQNLIGKGSNDGVLKMAFNFLSKTGRREVYLLKKQGAEIAKLKREQGAQIRKSVIDLNEARKAKVDGARKVFQLDREALINKQASEREELKKQWQTRNERRKEALKAVKAKEELRAKEKERRPVEQREEAHKPLKKEFKRSAEPREKRKRKPRPRGKSR